MSEVIIKIPEESLNASMTIIGKDGISKQKSIAIEDLVANLVSDYKLSTGLLPFGARYFKGSAADYTVAVEIPAKVRDMTIFRYNAAGTKKIDEVIQIAYPVCLFYFVIKSYKIHDIRVFALKYPLQTDNDTLFCFPFSNVYGDGRVCWGKVVLPKVSKPMELVGVINLFLSSQFNGDLSGHNFVSPKDKDIYDFWGVINYLKGMEEYPTDTLYASTFKFKTLCKDEE